MKNNHYICTHFHGVLFLVNYLIRLFRGVIGGLKYLENKVVYSILFITLAVSNVSQTLNITTYKPIRGFTATDEPNGFFYT